MNTILKNCCLFIIIIGLVYHVYKDVHLLQYVWIAIPAIYGMIVKNKNKALKWMMWSLLLYGFHIALTDGYKSVFWILTPFVYIMSIVYAENEIKELESYKKVGMSTRYKGAYGLNICDAIICIVVVAIVIIGFVVSGFEYPYSEAYGMLMFSGMFLFHVLGDLLQERHNMVKYLIEDSISQKLNKIRVFNGTDALNDAYSVATGDMWLSDYIFKHGHSYVDEIFTPEIVNNEKMKTRINILINEEYFGNKKVVDDKRVMYSEYMKEDNGITFTL